jgi:myo-inositol-1(or 4)-monophosphatase
MPNPNSPYTPTTEATQQIIAWARQAGQIALRYFNNVTPQIKPDQTLLTQADLEIESFLAERFRAAFPDHSLIGEEGARTQMDQLSPYLWTLDPLDGTTSFVQGLPGWGISIGLLDRGRPCFGLFYMPLLDDLTYTLGDDKVYCNERPLGRAVQAEWGDNGFLATSAGAHQDFQLDVPRTRTMGSVGANLVYTARGSAAGALLTKARLWDVVGGAAILARTGGELCYLSGQKINYLQLLDGNLAPEPIIAGHADMLVKLKQAIVPK